MSDIAEMLADTATRLLGDLSDRQTAAAAEAGDWPETLWNALEEAGLTSATGADAGADLGDVAIILRSAGGHAAPVPLAETLAAAWALDQAGVAVPGGPLTVGTCGTVELTRGGETWTASGTLSRVPWGARAALIVTIAVADGEPHLVQLAPGDAQVMPGRNVAGEPRDTLRFEAAPAVVVRSIVTADALRDRLRLSRLMQMAGAFNTVLEQTIRYAQERVQFGKPIARFQAIQQQIAVLAAEVAASCAAVATATAAADRGDAAFQIAAATVRICDAISQGASIAHQVHGAMGVTHEHSLHLSTRRLWSWRDEIENELDAARAIGLAAAKAGGRNLWALMISPSLERQVT